MCAYFMKVYHISTRTRSICAYLVKLSYILTRTRTPTLPFPQKYHHPLNKLTIHSPKL